MTQNLPSINLKIEQTQRKDTKNSLTARYIKSYTSKYMEQPWSFTLSNKKRDQVQKVRKIQIEREDKVLNNKMIAIKERDRYRSQSEVEAIYLKNSLNKTFRKELQKEISQQNKSNKKRLQSLKPTINLKKIQKEWQLKQSIKKNLQKYYSKDVKHRSMSIQFDKFHRIAINERKILKFYKQRCIEGCNILIKIEQYKHLVLITGEIRSKDQMVYLIIDKDKIQLILKEQNKNKIQILGNLLKFDSQTSSLYLIPTNSVGSQRKEYFISSKIDDFNLQKMRNQIRKQHIQLCNKQSIKKEDQKQQQAKTIKTQIQTKDINKTSL